MKKLRFRRQGLGSKIRIKPVWRKPRGWGSKQRKKKKGRRTAMPNIGYRSPRKTRGETYTLISNLKDIEGLKKGDTVMLKSKIGAKKKIEILTACMKKGLIVKNYKKIQETINKLKESFEKAKEKREKKMKEKMKKKEERKKKEKEVKKVVKIKKKKVEKKEGAKK